MADAPDVTAPAGPGEIKIPGVGPVKRQYVYAAAALVLGIVGYAWYARNRGGGGETVAIDPTTGLPLVPDDGVYDNPDPRQSVIDSTGGGIKTNQEWMAAVVEKLGNLGYESNYVSLVMTKYLAGQKVTAEEALLVRQAWTWVGYPPDGPRTINTGGTGDPTPDPDPDPPAGGTKLPPPTNLHVPPDSVRQWTDALEIHWNQVAGAKGYRLRDYVSGWTMDVGPVGGVMRYGLVHNGTYHMQIATIAQDGTVGDYSGTVAMHTKN